MLLCEHPDFDQAILNAAEHFKDRGLRAEFIEKDYYVTEALRAIAESHGDVVIFKGGTSLSKGWGLIERFSEDIDLFLDLQAVSPPLTSIGAIDRQLKAIRNRVAEHAALTLESGHSNDHRRGSKRTDRFQYTQQFGGPGGLANRIVLESGTGSGREPKVTRELRSTLAEFLDVTGNTLSADDETPFSMHLLHYRRTFVEKMFAIHSKIEVCRRDRTDLGAYARHYYDLYRLSGEPEVLSMLQSPEYEEIKEDYIQVSQVHFSRDYFCPADRRFAKSDALFPSNELATRIEPQYTEQCGLLCYGPYPTWSDVLARFEELRPML